MEFLFAISIGILVLAAACSLSGFAGHTFVSVLNYVELSNDSKNALDRMSQAIRNAASLKSYSSTKLVFADLDGNEIQFAYDPTLKTVTQTKGGVNTVLLRGCSSFKFSIYQSSPTKNSYDLLTATTNTCQVVQIQWACSRKLVSSRENTERQVSARMVMRN